MDIYKNITCPVCKGKKTLRKTAEEIAKAMRVYYPMKPCDNCNGRGKVYGKEEK